MGAFVSWFQTFAALLYLRTHFGQFVRTHIITKHYGLKKDAKWGGDSDKNIDWFSSSDLAPESAIPARAQADHTWDEMKLRFQTSRPLFLIWGSELIQILSEEIKRFVKD